MCLRQPLPWRPDQHEGKLIAETYKQTWSPWVVVVAILILAIPIIWGIAILTNLLAAMSIGGILVVAAIIGFFIWLRSRVERKVADG